MEHYNLNDKITELWNRFNVLFDDYQKEVMNRVPSYLSIPKSKNKILFIGLNPAFQQRIETHKSFINYSYSASITTDEIINFSKINSDSKDASSDYYYGKYFNILHNFAKKLGEDGFEHCDLFLMRETDSKMVKKMVENSDGVLNEFGKEQLNILKTHITNLNPKVIIIPNAMAAEYYRQMILQNSNIDEEKGIYYSEINNKKIPTILCGSWQYGRLDKYTEVILKRHIKTAMK
jgi:predicted GIY-YIG superfamily endonuclease